VNRELASSAISLLNLAYFSENDEIIEAVKELVREVVQ
jgi:hypothetical protein